MISIPLLSFRSLVVVEEEADDDDVEFGAEAEVTDEEDGTPVTGLGREENKANVGE